MNISNYSRIIVLGNNGAGKSWFAKRLAKITGLPLIHLDAAFWRPDWVMPAQAEWRERNLEFIAGEQWIIDGMCSHGGTLELRFAAAELAICLDVSRFVCLMGLLKRHGKPRSDTAIHAYEKWDRRFFKFCWAVLRRDNMKLYLKMHEAYPNTDFLVVKGRRGARKLLGEWKNDNCKLQKQLLTFDDNMDII